GEAVWLRTNRPAPPHRRCCMASNQPACAICGAPCIHGQSTMSLSGALAHANCYVARTHVTQRIADLLRQQPKGHFCSACIAAACSLPYRAVTGVVPHLQLRCGIRVSIGGPCTHCGKRRITIGVGPSPGLATRSYADCLDTDEVAPRDATERIADFLRQWP